MKRVVLAALALAAISALGAVSCAPPPENGENGGNGNGGPEPVEAVMWINHLDMLAGDPSVQVSFNAVTSGVGGGLSGLIIESTTVGDTATPGGNKVVQKGTLVPPGYLVTGVRTCYELSNARSFITQVRLAQVQDPPASAIVRLDDGTDLVDPGPLCVDSAATQIDPSEGELLLSLRVNFGDTGDRIVVRALGLHLRTAP